MCHPCPHPSLSPSMRCVGCLLAPINATSRSESPHVVVGCGFQTRRAHQLADRSPRLASPRLCLLCARVDEVNSQKLLHLRDDAGRPEPRRGRLFSEMGGTDGSIASIDGFDRKDWLVSVQLGWGGVGSGSRGLSFLLGGDEKWVGCPLLVACRISSGLLINVGP
jgi:hypothetical protein